MTFTLHNGRPPGRLFSSENGEREANLEMKVGVSMEKFVDGAGGTGELGVIVIMDNDNSPLG